MRSLTTTLIWIVGLNVICAQVPLGFSFQTIIRDSEGKVQKNQSTGIQFSILEGSAMGTVVYSETHTITTNEYGVINLTVGTGTVTEGVFADIVWGSNIHFLKTEIDPTGGNTYTISTTSQLMSVPYAMYAMKADTALKVPDSSITNEIQVLSISNDTIYLSDGGFAKLPAGFDGDYTSLTNKPTIPASISDLTNDSGFLTTEVDGSITNEIQTISKVDRIVTLSNNGGSYVDSVLTEAQVDAYTNDNGYLTLEVDGSITNEIQTISKVDRTVTLSNNGGSYVDSVLTEAQVDAYTNDNGYLTSEVDGSTTNEIQVLSISNDTIYLSDGGFAKLPAGFDGDYTSLTNKPTIPTNTSDLTNDSGFLTSEVDGSITNEIQVLSISNDTIYLSDGGYAKLPGDSIPAYGKEGQLLYRNQGKWDTLAVGAVGQQLVINESGLPEWTTVNPPALSVSVNGDTLYSGIDSYVIIPGISINNPPVIMDIAGNTYQTVWIGDQLWFAENLKTTHYNDGTPIQLVSDGATWSGLIAGARVYYNNDSSTYAPDYGALYNWYAVETGKLCPTGWHVPTDAEWTVLTDYLGGASVTGGKLKEVGTVHWESPNFGATDEVGFTALPGGLRSGSGLFDALRYLGYWWSATPNYSDHSWYRSLYYYDAYVGRSYDFKRFGFSVRCLRD
jgi:uncharacterized protein (TIGR02145 family)